MTLADTDYVVVSCELHSKTLANELNGQSRSAESDAKLDYAATQIARDALIGTFGDFAPAVFSQRGEGFPDRFSAIVDSSADVAIDYDLARPDDGVWPFQLKLQAKYFTVFRGGLQHLIQVLCGDLFSRALVDINGSAKVLRTDLGNLRQHFDSFYAPKSHSSETIQNQFHLLNAKPIYNSKDRNLLLPLLAFSVKPRNGLDPEKFKRISCGVLRAGFNLVEVDVRNIDFFDESWRAVYHSVAADALKIDTHVARFSLNLSGPADLALRYAEEFAALHSGHAPWVVKVDGGLDGLSTVQALRERFVDNQPIITCYPTLNKTLSQHIGANTLRDMLVLSGVDVIYPGGAPRIGVGDFVDLENEKTSYRNYRTLIQRGRPMPTIAGGVHAGQLPAYYRMFGPSVAYFIGGGVSLHRNGPISPGRGRRPQLGRKLLPDQAAGGAELCRFAVEAAAMGYDADALFAQLGAIADHYIDTGDTSRFQYQKPDEYLKLIRVPDHGTWLAGIKP